jgi:ketosteroid isomerase-like protein
MRNVVVTRVQYDGPPRRSRNLEERLMVRFPSLYRRLAAAFWRLLSPRSRLRRAILRRGLLSGWAASSRRDFELVVVRYAPDVEVEFDPGIQTLGVGGTFRGHEGMVEAYRELLEAWDQELEPTCVLDLGDRMLCLGFFRSHAHASGVQLEREVAQLLTMREGLVARDQAFFGWDEGLRAASLDPDGIALPSTGKAHQATSSGG